MTKLTNDERKELAGRLRDRARYDSAVDPLKLLTEAADLLDRIAAPEGVGLTRYKLWVDILVEEIKGDEDPEGDWVRHDDAAAALAAKDAEIARIKDAGRALLNDAAKAAIEVEAQVATLKEALSGVIGTGQEVMEQLLWGDLPDTATVNFTAPLGKLRAARAALSTLPAPAASGEG